MGTSEVTRVRMDDLQWPRLVNRVITRKWSQLKNTLVMRDFVDYLIQKRVVTLDYWMGLKSKPITESERTEDFLALVLKFDQKKYNLFLESLLTIHREDLVQELVVNSKTSGTRANNNDKGTLAKGSRPKTPSPTKSENVAKDAKNKSIVSHKTEPVKGKTDVDQNSNLLIGETNGKTEESQNEGNNTADPLKPALVGQQASVEKQNAQSKTFHHTEPNLRELDAREKEAMLAERERRLESRESALSKKEQALEEQEALLKEKETKLVSREASLLSMKNELPTDDPVMHQGLLLTETVSSEHGPISLPAQLRHMQQYAHTSNHSTPSNTQSSELLADVREQLVAMKKVKEDIISECPTTCSTPKEEYVKMNAFQTVQQDLDEIKEEIATDRSDRTHVQLKMEDIQGEVSTLKQRIQQLEAEKNRKEVEINTDVNRMKAEIKNSKLSHNESINKIKIEIKSKEEEIKQMKRDIDEHKKHSESLEKRIEELECDRQQYEQELQRYEDEVSDLKQTMAKKENELKDLQCLVEVTEGEKEELIDELASLKHEITRLKCDKKRLEQEKKTLLSRCVKPQWNQSTSGPKRSTTFK